MEIQAHVGYQQVLEMVYQLPPADVGKLLKKLQTGIVVSKKQVAKKEEKLTKMQELLLHAPTWSDKEYHNYLEAREYVNRWRE